MAIDTIIDYSCDPKDALTTEGILKRLKDRHRALQIVQMYRDEGDERPLSEIGFEVTRRSADGTEETALVIASDLLAEAAVLDEWAGHCTYCPANLTDSPYGCVGYVNYPILRQSEIWWLEQLPTFAQPVLFLMLIRGVQEFGYTGQSARELRDRVGVYFENPDTLARRYAQIDVTADVLFEMTFQLGPIQPSHGVLLLLFYHAIPRDNLDPAEVMALTRQEIDPQNFAKQYPFLHQGEPDEDPSIKDLKRFMQALYVAYQLNVALLLDI